jgi:hypothetical protein
MSLSPKLEHTALSIDFEVGNQLIEVKVGVTALRSVRMGLMQLAYAIGHQPGMMGILVLRDMTVTRKRLEDEWKLVASVLRPDVLRRLSLCINDGDHFEGIPRDPDLETQRVLADVVAAELPHSSSHVARAHASFAVLKILLLEWLKGGKPITAEYLVRSSGYSYPTVAKVLQSLGSLVERQSDRRVSLRWFPKDEFARMLAMSDRARSTVRFTDRSGQPRSFESYLRRLEVLHPQGLAIGGVLGAKHYFPNLDLVGTPRLDISLHCPGHQMDLSFIELLDPALKRVSDPLEPATLVVHAVRHVNPFFAARENGLTWADPLECLMDLHEARLEKQAVQFLDALQQNRPAESLRMKEPL